MVRSDSGTVGYDASNRRLVLPTEISSPSTSFRSRTPTPFTRVPFVDPRSTTTKSAPRRTHLGVAAADVRVGERHLALGQPTDAGRLVAEPDALPVRQHQRAHGPASGRLLDRGGHEELARAQARVVGELDEHRAHERVLLLAGVSRAESARSR